MSTLPAKPHVWGIGLSRTGTKSLNQALCHLGYRAVHWPTTRQLLYDDLEAATDESVGAVFRFLDRKYPGSRFVLTERDEHSWIASTRAQRARFAAYGRMLQSVCGGHGSARDRAVEVQFTQMTLYGTTSFDEQRFRDAFRAHHDAVARYFADRGGDLLRLRICDGDGWPELCAFLRCPVPRLPFPRANTSRERGG